MASPHWGGKAFWPGGLREQRQCIVEGPACGEPATGVVCWNVHSTEQYSTDPLERQTGQMARTLPSGKQKWAASGQTSGRPDPAVHRVPASGEIKHTQDHDISSCPQRDTVENMSAEPMEGGSPVGVGGGTKQQRTQECFQSPSILWAHPT